MCKLCKKKIKLYKYIYECVGHRVFFLEFLVINMIFGESKF
jgi:hypothetical protein